ncbi:MAG: hypothetical protein BWY79_02041 [Actinobacteria bacterium ADurb.Bin444]|nr:MAG: hypothetical protein BWY79_02041 [Actinobacteria bacterium ADurb.Bin444]
MFIGDARLGGKELGTGGMHRLSHSATVSRFDDEGVELRIERTQPARQLPIYRHVVGGRGNGRSAVHNAPHATQLIIGPANGCKPGCSTLHRDAIVNDVLHFAQSEAHSFLPLRNRLRQVGDEPTAT